MVLWRSFIIVPTGHIEKTGLPFREKKGPSGPCFAIRYGTGLAKKKIVEKTRIPLDGCDMSITAEKTVGFG